MIVRRYPKSENKSLRPSSAADELMLEYTKEQRLDLSSSLMINDRFGYLACTLNEFSPVSLINYKSQEKALRLNLIANELPLKEGNFIYPFSDIEKKISTVLIKAPKSLDLFKLQLVKINASISDDGVVVCGFMTRHFSKQMVEIANEFFEEVEQSQAKKKARLLILKKKKTVNEVNLINEVKLDKKVTLKQYFGVFSANNVDYATQFLLENLKINDGIETVLDLASGNGVIAHAIKRQNKTAELHLVDDSFLAVESGKLNLIGDNIYHHFSDGLENFLPKFFDLVVCNPPFHFEHETNIEVSLQLFKEVKKALKPTGHFQVVANQHLNYKTHLSKFFTTVNITAENDKFIIYDCVK